MISALGARWATVVVVGLASVQPVDAQASPLDRMRTLADMDSAAALGDAVHRHPDVARELLRRSLVDAGFRSDARGDSGLARAGRIAEAIAETWRDSFPRAQVERFARMTAAERRAKIRADSMRWRGNTTLARAGADSALEVWRRALRMSTVIADTPGIAATTGNIGAGFYRADRLDSAEVHLSHARELAEMIGDRVTTSNAIGALGNVARDRGELARAQALYDSALTLREALGDRRGAAADHNNLGLLAAELGDMGAARVHHGRALAIAREHSLAEAEATTLMNIGNLASTAGEYATAARHYEEALTIYRASKSDVDAALVLHNLGLLASRRGDYRGARTRLEEALRIFARAGTATDLVLVRSDLASVVAAMGDLQGALSQLTQAERLIEGSTPDPELAASVALARAEISARLNTLPEAERHYARAEGLYRRAGNSAGQADAQQGRAVLLAARRQYPQALTLLRAAGRVQTSSGDRRQAAVTQLMIGYVLHAQGDLAAARRTLDGAVTSLAALRDAAGEAAALGALGEVEMDAGSPLVAESLFRRALARIATRPAPTLSWHLRAGLGRALHSRGASDAAAHELRAAVADVERIAITLTVEERRSSFLADKWDAYAQLALVERARGDIGAAFAAAEHMRARQMLDLLARGRMPAGPDADSALVGRAEDARRRVAELTSRLEFEEGEAIALRGNNPGAAPSAVTREALARAHEEYESAFIALRETESAYGRITRGEAVEWRDVARRLQRGEALIEYLVLDSATMAFVLTPDTIRIVTLDIDRVALAALVDFAHGMLGRPQVQGRRSEPASREFLQRLHGYLVAPLEDAGALAGVRRLVIVPNGELHYLPFAALLAGPGRSDAGRYLIEQYEIGYAPSASVWVRIGARAAPRSTSILALAPRGQALPGSLEEVQAIRRIYGSDATVLTGATASEQAFRAAAGRHGIVHLATYGVLNKHNPLFSFVSLHPAGGTDGRLEVHEVFSIGINARLLILSACQTALASGALSDVPAGDDWVGLVRAFLGAGADNVVATLWPVEDRSTATTMIRFHERLRSGESEVTALAAAQRAMLRDARTAHPFYWAGFVLVGGR